MCKHSEYLSSESSLARPWKLPNTRLRVFSARALTTLRLVSNTQASSISCRLCLSIKRTPRNVGWHRESRCPLEFRRHFTEWNRDALQLDPRYCGKILARNGIVASRSMHFWHAGLRRAAWDRYHPHTYVHIQGVPVFNSEIL